MIRANRAMIVSTLLCLAWLLSACTGGAGASGDSDEPMDAVTVPPEGSATAQPATAEQHEEPPPVPSPADIEEATRLPIVSLTPKPALTLQPGRERGGAPQELVEAIQEDLAARLGVPESELMVIQTEATTWPDSSLGCAQKGMSYLQVVTDGYWVVLNHGEETYDYRADDRGNFFLCERGLPPGLAPPAGKQGW